MRWGRLFRADDLAALSDGDLDRLTGLGLRTIVDLRAEYERARHADRLPVENAIRTLHAGFMDDEMVALMAAVARNEVSARAVDEGMIAQYRLYVTRHVLEYRAMIHHLADSDNVPALVHCTSGKDRTGFAIAVVLMAVGADRDTILEDYLLTNAYRRNVDHLFRADTASETIDVLLSVREAYLEAAFDQIRATFGSVDAYLERGLALTERDRALLRANFTEDDA